VDPQVETDSARIAKEEIECQAIATDAQADLDVALPALERAMAEVRLSMWMNSSWIAREREL
jgi:dynein heavy chain